MSAGQSQGSVASSTRRRQEADLAVAEKRERAAADAVAAAARASRLAAAELAAARAEVEAAAAAADAARAAAAEVEVLRGSNNSSIAADDSADADLELLEREASRGRAAQWAVAHAHGRGGSQTGANTPSALLKEARTAVALLEEARTAAAYRSMESAAFTGGAALSPRFGTVVTTSTRLSSGTSAPAADGLPSPRPTTLSGLR
jgi:hypothetical protein